MSTINKYNKDNHFMRILGTQIKSMFYNGAILAEIKELKFKLLSEGCIYLLIELIY